MPIIAKTTDNRGTKKRRNEVKFRTTANTTATFESYPVDTKTYDTRSKYIERAKGIQT